jgi:signal transduction histidine kinase
VSATAPKRKVLVVDDNPVDRDLVAAFLDKRYTVLRAANATAGLELYRAERPDCVLLDHNLPGVAGLDAIKSYTAEGAAVVMLTGGGSDALSAEAFKRGARDYVLKTGLNRAALERIVAREIERRQLELGLREAQERLQLAEKLEAIGQLAAGVAHEINTPAHYVGDNISFLATALADLLPVLTAFKRLAAEDGNDELRALAAKADLEYLLAEIPAALKAAAGGIQQIKHIVTAMKEFSHPGEQVQQIDLNHAIESTVTVARHEWKYVAEVALELAQDLPLVRCFPSQINQVVLNLVVNAAQAVAERVAGGTDKGRIRVSTARAGGHVTIAVEDDGVGIPKAIRSRIFDPFFTTKEPGKGTGQGLAIVHRIVVEHHRGEIRVESEPGAGARFEVVLPIDAGSFCGEAAGGAPTPSEVAAGRSAA